MIQIHEITEWSELSSLRLAWKLLLARTRGATFFHSWEWLNTFAAHFGDDVRPRIVVASFDGETLGILPLVVKAERNRLGTFRALTYPLDDWGNFYGAIGRDQTLILRAGLQHIANTPRNFDVINLCWVPKERHDRGRTRTAMQAAGFQAHQRREASSAFIDLQATWEDYWASRSSKWRNNVRRSERKLSEAGEVAYVHYRPRGKAFDDADPKWDLYESCERIAESSWQSQSSTGTTLSHPQIRDFVRDMHETAVNAGGLDLHLLYVNDRPAAFAYNYHYRGVISGLRTGFDPNISRDGAGTVLMYRSIQTAYEWGDETLDMGADYLDCKNNWLTSTVAAYAYSHFPLAVPTAQLVRLKRIWEARRERKLAAKEMRTATETPGT